MQTVANCPSPQACNNVTVNPLPVIGSTSSSNPTTCSGTDGSITINGLNANQQYSVSYSLNNAAQGPFNITANGSGSVVISNLGAGAYTNIIVSLNGCHSAPQGGTITLSNPSTPSAPSVGSNSPVCQNSPLTLNASGQLGASYSWTGPLSYTSSQQNPTVSNSATLGMAGNYCATQTVAKAYAQSPGLITL